VFRSLVSYRFVGNAEGGWAFYWDEVETARYLQANTSISDRIQAWGWGIESNVFYWAQRLAATRFQETKGLVMRKPGTDLFSFQKTWREEFLRSVQNSPPVYFVVLDDPAGDFAHTYPYYYLEFPELIDWIGGHYDLEEQIGVFKLFRYKANKP